MPLTTLTSPQNADYDLTSPVAVFTYTPPVASLCRLLLEIGDGADDLDGSGGEFELVVSLAGRTIQPSPQPIAFSAVAAAAVWTGAFCSPAGSQIIVSVKSPNAADINVDVTATLFDVSPGGGDIDSTGSESVTRDKAIEAMLAVLMGISAGTSSEVFMGRNGSTAIVANTLTGPGVRTTSEIDPA